jgi:hypothetical protein
VWLCRVRLCKMMIKYHAIMCLIKWAIELKNRDMVLVSTKIPCVLLCNYLLLHIFWEEFEPHNLHVFFFFSADFWPDRIHRSLPSRIIVAVVCLPTRWRSRDLMPKRAHHVHCRIDLRFLLPLPHLPLPADVSSHVVSVKVYGPRSVRKKSNAPARREK